MIFESVTYNLFLDNENEAYFLSALLNSSIPNKLIKDFQSKGLFGARHVHKKILDIYFPKFDENDEQHLQLAELSKQAHQKAKKYIEANSPQQSLTANRLGRLRIEIKKHLSKEMKEMDKIVKKLIG
jgi:hypothetical protein